MGRLGFRGKLNRAIMGRNSALRLFKVAYDKIVKANTILEENQREIAMEQAELERIYRENKSNIEENAKLQEELKRFLPSEDI